MRRKYLLKIALLKVKILMFSLFFSALFSQTKTITFTESDSAIFINPSLDYYFSKSSTIPPDFNTAKPIASYSAFKDSIRKAPQYRSVWGVMKVRNLSKDSVLFINAKEYVAKLRVYEKVNGKLKESGITGFNISRSLLHAKNGDLYHIRIHVPVGAEKTFYFQSSLYRNQVFFPELDLITYTHHLSLTDAYFSSSEFNYYQYTLFFIGIHFCLMVLALSRFRAQQFRLALLVFAGINLFYIFYYLAEYDFIDFENKLFPGFIHNNYVTFLGAIEPGLYYIFFWSYLDRDKNLWFRRFLLACSAFWIAFYFMVNVNWDYVFLSKLSVFTRNFGPMFDLLVTGLVFVYLMRYKSTFYKYARMGVFILLISAIQLSIPYFMASLGINNEMPRFISNFSLLVMQICIVLDFILFLYGQNRNEIELQAEKENIKKQLLQKEIERQESILAERRRISLDMHDDLGAGISALKLQAEFLKKKLDDESLKQDVHDILVTSEEMNLSMREILWSLNSSNDTVKSLVDYISVYAENFLRKSGIRLEMQVDKINRNELIDAESRRNIFLVCKESLNNIYKHSNAKNVKISFFHEGEFLHVVISDDGCGIPENSVTGNGLINMKERVEEIHGELNVSSNNRGTSIHIKLKKDKEKLL